MPSKKKESQILTLLYNPLEFTNITNTLGVLQNHELQVFTYMPTPQKFSTNKIYGTNFVFWKK